MPIGKHVVDFACEEARLVIEVDGGQHERAADQPRTDALEAAGYLALRFWNHDVLENIDAVVAEIDRTAAASL
jgi:very-short-patch-repair endonuclease